VTGAATTRLHDNEAILPYLQLHSVTKTFGRFIALTNISLTVERGEFICCLGPSGCGKTTLLRIIAGLDAPNSGRIIQNGVDISRLPPTKRDYGIVFQSYALFPNLTAAQNVAFGLENRKAPRLEIQRHVQQLLALVGLEHMANRYPAQLSGGQQQRVALARALALSPGLLLLDEPLSALDARVRLALRGEILQLHRRLGVTTIMVTHDQEEALTMADRIVVMDQGHIVQIGTPLEVYAQPASHFVADFVGTMNFLPGIIGERGHVCCGEVVFALDSPLRGMAPNTPVMLAIRPEELQVVDAATPATESLLTEVSAAEFLGPFYRLHVRTKAVCHNGAPVSLVVDIPAQEARRLALHLQKTLRIRLPHEAVRLFSTATDRECV
jgi:iron(III) transport system ATP-binding protein